LLDFLDFLGFLDFLDFLLEDERRRLPPRVGSSWVWGGSSVNSFIIILYTQII
jgi:hypothetical protein